MCNNILQQKIILRRRKQFCTLRALAHGLIQDPIMHRNAVPIEVIASHNRTALCYRFWTGNLRFLPVEEDSKVNVIPLELQKISWGVPKPCVFAGTRVITVWGGRMGCRPSGRCSTLCWDLGQRNNIIHLLPKCLPLTVTFPTIRTVTTGKFAATSYLMLRHPWQGVSIEVFLSIPVLNAEMVLLNHLQSPGQLTLCFLEVAQPA